MDESIDQLPLSTDLVSIEKKDWVSLQFGTRLYALAFRSSLTKAGVDIWAGLRKLLAGFMDNMVRDVEVVLIDALSSEDPSRSSCRLMSSRKGIASFSFGETRWLAFIIPSMTVCSSVTLFRASMVVALASTC